MNYNTSFNPPLPGTPNSAQSSMPTCYLKRDADIALIDALKAQQFCAVFAPPQSGKTSLNRHVTQRLATEDIACLTIDLAKGPAIAPHHSTHHSAHKPTVDPYGYLILSDLWHSMTDLPPQHLPFWLSTHPSHTIMPQLDQLLEEILLVHCEERAVVIFVDGLDAHLAHNSSIQELLRLIRRCYNRRTRDPIYGRLTFCLLGNTNPTTLMLDLNDDACSPVPICQSIDLPDFTVEEMTAFELLLADVVADPELALRLIWQLTQGQPALTAQLCQQVRHNAIALANPHSFDLNTIPDIVYTQMMDANHFQRMSDRLHQTGTLFESCLARYQRILIEGDSPVVGSAVDHQVATELALAGFITQQGNRWAIANPIYQDRFDRTWQLQSVNAYRATRSHARSERVCATLCK